MKMGIAEHGIRWIRTDDGEHWFNVGDMIGAGKLDPDHLPVLAAGEDVPEDDAPARRPDEAPPIEICAECSRNGSAVPPCPDCDQLERNG